MRGKNKEIMRAYSLIESDRLSTGDDFFEVLKRDLTILLKDYFEFNGNVNVAVIKNEGKNEININLVFDRIRSFGTLPKR